MSFGLQEENQLLCDASAAMIQYLRNTNGEAQTVTYEIFFRAQGCVDSHRMVFPENSHLHSSIQESPRDDLFSPD
jgi:hypothetical protein